MITRSFRDGGLITLVVIVCIGVPMPPLVAQAADSISSDSSIDKAVQDVFKEYEGKVEENYADYKAKVEAVWNEYRESTKKVWVDYSKDVSALSAVDFKSGEVSLETMVPVSEDSPEKVRKEILGRLQNSLSANNPAGVSPLEGQLKFPGTGEEVKRENTGRFFREEIEPNLEKERIQSRDGVARYHYSVKIHLIPEHLQVRARRFLPDVMEFAQNYGLSPALVLAVIHTESWFNPLAVSKAGAYGLMQLIPDYGAKDSYRFVYGKAAAPSKSFLFIPRNNIQLGTAYLYLIRHDQLKYHGDDDKGKILTLCAYNWGPGSVNSKIIGSNRIEDLDVVQLKRIIRQRAPAETADYFAKILEREKVYERMFD